VEYIGCFNYRRLHESLGDLPPVEYEHLHTNVDRFSEDETVQVLSPSALDALTTRPFELVGAQIAHERLVGSENRSVDEALPAQAALESVNDGLRARVADTSRGTERVRRVGGRCVGGSRRHVPIGVMRLGGTVTAYTPPITVVI
jgi:hypothetical protein